MCILVLLGAEGGCFDDNFDYDDFQNRGRRWAIACLLFGVSAPALFLISAPRADGAWNRTIYTATLTPSS